MAVFIEDQPVSQFFFNLSALQRQCSLKTRDRVHKAGVSVSWAYLNRCAQPRHVVNLVVKLPQNSRLLDTRRNIGISYFFEFIRQCCIWI